MQVNLTCSGDHSSFQVEHQAALCFYLLSSLVHDMLNNRSCTSCCLMQKADRSVSAHASKLTALWICMQDTSGLMRSRYNMYPNYGGDGSVANDLGEQVQRLLLAV